MQPLEEPEQRLPTVRRQTVLLHRRPLEDDRRSVEDRCSAYETYGHIPGFGRLFPSSDYFLPSAMPPLVRVGGRSVLEALTAVDRLAAIRLEGNLSLDAAGRTNGIEHLTRRTTTAVAATTTVTAATVAATAATALLCGVTARLAFARGLKPFALIECLLFLGEHEAFTADCAREFLGCHSRRTSFHLTGTLTVIFSGEVRRTVVEPGEPGLLLNIDSLS
jgi:hypothetical protein